MHTDKIFSPIGSSLASVRQSLSDNKFIRSVEVPLHQSKNFPSKPFESLA